MGSSATNWFPVWLVTSCSMALRTPRSERYASACPQRVHCEFSKKATCLHAEQVKIFMAFLWAGSCAVPQGTMKVPQEDEHLAKSSTHESFSPIQSWQSSSLFCLSSLLLASLSQRSSQASTS